jgi:hypothetical protein
MSIITIAIIVAILTAFGYGEVNGSTLARTARRRPTRQRLAPDDLRHAIDAIHTPGGVHQFEGTVR